MKTSYKIEYYVNFATSQIEDIIAEQWIQIRQFEQAFVLTKVTRHVYLLHYSDAVLH